MPDEISLSSGLKELIQDIQNGLPLEIMAHRFHYTLADAFSEAAYRLSQRHEINTVVLSGGCFQNALLLDMMIDALRSKKLNTLTHHQIPPNDGGLSLGQVWGGVLK